MDNFIKSQLIGFFFISLQTAFLIPLIVKFQGIYWSLTLIIIYEITVSLAQTISILLKNTNVKKLLKSMIFLDILYLLITITFFIDVKLFLILETIVFAIYSFVSPTFHINFKAMISKEYSNNYKHILHYDNLANNLATFIGLSIALILSLIFIEYEFQIYMFLILILISIIYNIYNYNKFWKNKS